MTCEAHSVSTLKQKLYWPSLLVLLFIVWLLAAISDQRQKRISELQENLAGQLLRAETIIDASPTATISCSADHHILVVSKAAERLFGYRSSDLVGKSINLLMPSEYHSKHLESTTRAENRIRQLPGNWYTPPKDFYGVGITRMGDEIPLHVSVTTIKYGATKSNPKGTVEFVARLRKADEPLPPVQSVQPLPPVRDDIKSLIEKK